VTFLFTDIEASTRRWEEMPEPMRDALARHDQIVRGSIEGHGGYVFATGGDGFAAAFGRAGDAVAAAVRAQAALNTEAWPEEAAIRVRIGMHTGEAFEREGDYFGPAVNRTARLMALANGGQVLCSSVTAELAQLDVPLTDLGEHRLRDLSAPQRVFQVGDGRFPPLRSVDAFPGNLPLQVSSFVGRETELTRVGKALHEARVVTLTGVGGVGKTRLALQAAAELLPDFREGAWLVELAPIRDPDEVVGAFASAFGVNAGAGQTVQQSLLEFLRTKQLLLVVDNCEHLLDPVGDLVELLQRSCPRLVVLATSREGLALEGERVVPVPPLGGPPSSVAVDAMRQSDAVRLFVERAGSMDPEFTLTAQNAASVAEVCRRLDGLPLAIELAAARVGAMNPAELAHALERRFDTLAGGRRRAVRRHQTLRSAIDWSYELCSEPERRLLARLAVFAGGGSRAAVEAVCAGGPIEARSVFELLAGLVAKYLVVADRESPETRYRLLETIGEYAEERLTAHEETEALRDRHAEYYAGFLHTVYEDLFGPQQVAAGKRFAAEHENLLAAIGHAIDAGDADLALRFLRYQPLGNQIGYALFLPVERVLTLPGTPEHRWYPYALALAAQQASLRGDVAPTEVLIARSMAAERLGAEPDWRADYLRAIALMGEAIAAGDHGDSAAHGERAGRIAQTAGATGEAAFQFGGAAVEWALAGDTDAAAALASEGLALARQGRMPLAIASNLNGLALALAESEPERARMLLRESRDMGSNLGYENGWEVTQGVLVSARLGDWAQVLDAAPTAIRHLHWNNAGHQLAAIVNLVARALAPNSPEAAAVLQGAARELALSLSPSLGAGGGDGTLRGSGPNRRDATAGMITDLRRQTTGLLIDSLGEPRVRELRADGAGMDIDHIVAYVLGAMEQACHDV
jgi:predicted ATPase